MTERPETPTIDTGQVTITGHIHIHDPDTKETMIRQRDSEKSQHDRD